MPTSEPAGKLSRALLKLPVPWVFVLAYLIGVAIELAFHVGAFTRDYAFLTPAGIAVFIVGAVIAGWGWLIFHRAGTTRVPGETSTTFVNWGPYRFTRNPMYVGLSIAYLGEAAIQHQIAPVVLLPLTIAYVNGVVIPLEENRLHAAFGAAYDKYRTQVRRWL